MKDRMEPTLAALWERSRFASYFYQGVHFIPDDRVPTLALTLRESRLAMHYRPAFIETISEDELIGLLVHEMLHVALNHDHRAYPDGDLYLQNLSQDMVINSFISSRRKDFFSRRGGRPQHDLILPEGLPLVPRLYAEETGIDDPSWEELYAWLRSLPRGEVERHVTRTKASPGIHLPPAANPPGDILAADLPGFRHEADRNIVDVADCKGMVFIDDRDAIVPTGVHLFLDPDMARQKEAKKSAVLSLADGDLECREERAYLAIRALMEHVRDEDTSSWRRVLRSIIDNSAYSNEFTYSFGRFNRRFLAGGIYAPGRVFKQREIITAAVDLSGSMVMTPEDIEAAFGVIESLLDRYRVHLVCVDEDLFVPERSGGALARSDHTDRPCVYRKGDWRHLASGSGGTTMFAPLFNRYLRGHRETVLVLTDGYIYDLDRLRRHAPTVWIIAASRREPFSPPFGRIVQMRHAGHAVMAEETQQALA